MEQTRLLQPAVQFVLSTNATSFLTAITNNNERVTAYLITLMFNTLSQRKHAREGLQYWKHLGGKLNADANGVMLGQAVYPPSAVSLAGFRLLDYELSRMVLI